MGIFRVGEPWPGMVPGHEGGQIELGDAGLSLFVQMPGPSPDEIAAFKASFSEYWILDAFPVIWLCFRFGPPLDFVECNFDARIVRRSRIDNYLDTSGGIKNRLSLYLLDGQLLRAAKLVGLSNEAASYFQGLLARQISEPYSRRDFLLRLGALEAGGSWRDLAAVARRWEHRRIR